MDLAVFSMYFASSACAEDATNLFDVFGRQLAGIGKMLMCLDKMKEGNYTIGWRLPTSTSTRAITPRAFGAFSRPG